MFVSLIQVYMDKFNQNLKRFQPYEVIASKLIEKYKNVEIFKFCNNNKYDSKDSRKLQPLQCLNRRRLVATLYGQKTKNNTVTMQLELGRLKQS